MECKETALGRRTGLLVAKNLIILLVLVAVCVLAVWAWFTSSHTADANGINVVAKGEGVQVSWDGKSFYDDLTASTNDEVVAEKVGLAKDLGSPLSLDLITGDGINFFKPLTNRRTGDVVAKGNVWQGTAVTKSTGNYVDFDLYFRSTAERDVYLTGESRISPKSDTERMSDYGDFSKDNIAAASRVAFLDKSKENCSFIWAPNDDGELISSDGYTKYTTTVTEEVVVSGGTSIDIDGGVTNDKKTYYFWSLYDDAVVGSYPQDLSKFEARKFVYDNDIHYFTTEVTLYIPTYGGDNPSIPIFINESESADKTAINSYNQYVDGAESKLLNRKDLGQYFGITETNFNIGDYTCSNAMYLIDTSKISTGSKITFKVGYDPVNKLLVMLSYTVEGGGSFKLDDKSPEVKETVTYFPLEDNVSCALVCPNYSVSISSGANYFKAINFKNFQKLTVTSESISAAEMFTAQKNGEGYKATYKFLNKNTGTYLTFADDNIKLDSVGSDFSLVYNQKYDSPLLKSGDYFLAFKGGKVVLATDAELSDALPFTLYKGTYYSFKWKSSEAQPYIYYNSESSELVQLNASTTPKLYTSKSTSVATERIGTKIATLSKSEGEDYYTAHIVVRVWVEGTDREAKLPLADGIFNVSLCFTSV